MRDKIKDKEYYKEYIAEEISRINKFESKLQKNEVNIERILPVKRKIQSLRFQILIARYSMGEEIINLCNDYKQLIINLPEVWNPDLYVDILWMLSIGIMLDIEDEILSILKKLIKNSKINDWLFNLLMDYKYKDLNKIEGELLFEEPYRLLHEIVYYKENKIDELKDYIQNKWYIGHSDTSWYDIHKSKEKLYYGYWSFETGAIVKILGLDDSKLKDLKYYPYDLVHYKN